MMLNVALLLVYFLTSTVGLMQIKSAGVSVTSGFAVGMILYLLGFAIWLYILQRLPLSVAFPIAAGGLIVATQVAGRVFLGEALQPTQITGVVLILGGIGLIFARAA